MTLVAELHIYGGQGARQNSEDRIQEKKIRLICKKNYLKKKCSFLFFLVTI